MRLTTVPTLLGIALLSSCTWDEGLVIENMKGKVIVTREAATQRFGDADVTDVRLIGPVYLGLFSGIDETSVGYPHPTMGPALPGSYGDTYPYGGTTIGDIRFGCMEFFKCKMVSGRYVDFDDIVDWFNNVAEQQITDQSGAPVETGEYIRQTCYELLNYTADEEIRITATDDRNDDGVLDHKDLDFVENADGDFEAEFTIWQQEYFPGFTLWGWMDAPTRPSMVLDTCDRDWGYRDQEYSASYYSGAQYPDLLNSPVYYMGADDWVAGTWHTYESLDDEVTIIIDTPVSGSN